MKEAENDLKKTLGLKDDQSWVLTVIFAVGSCLCTAIMCCICNYCMKKYRQYHHDEEMKAE